MEKINNKDSIILLTKTPGPTSFKSLNSVKKALNTTKVGHTGTLDSFAQGLLVVCTGRLTRLAGNITAFNKTYQAVIKFGEETDTLEYTGKIVKTAPLPTVDAFTTALAQFTGNLMQTPPAFSAIHMEGKRASDIAKKGVQIELPARPITVFNSKILELKFNDDNKNLVEYALVEFSVSKGTYIRSLARDIAAACGSVGHLVGLYRTKVGNFDVKDSAGYDKLPPFSIKNAIQTQKVFLSKNDDKKVPPERQDSTPQKFVVTPQELAFQEEIRQKTLPLTPEIATQCGFLNIFLICDDGEAEFKNGKPLRSKNFNTSLYSLPINSTIAVFTKNGIFVGLIEKNADGKVRYKFVVN